MKQLKCGCVKDETRNNVMVFPCKKHKQVAPARFVFERDPVMNITKHYFNGQLVTGLSYPVRLCDGQKGKLVGSARNPGTAK